MTTIYQFFGLYWLHLLLPGLVLLALYLLYAREQARRALAGREMFFSTMCHEIRTPLNAVIGITNLLLQEVSRPEQVEKLKVMKFSAEHLLLLLNDVLECSRLGSGKVAFEESDFSLSELLYSLQQAHACQAAQKGLTLQLCCEPGVPKMLNGDPGRLTQVLNNLLSNALRFTDTGTVALHVRLEEEKQEQVRLHFAVSDTGIGIPSDKLAYIFEAFTQAEALTARRHGGTGLGLSIVKQLLELQNSRIEVESTPGRGSCFSFSLAFKKASPRAVLPGKVAGQTAGCFSGKNLRLLLIEDDEASRMVAGSFLQQWGLAVEQADSGRSALEKINTQHYDLILLDLQLPDISGYQLARQLRKQNGDYFKNVPLIALSASGVRETAAQIAAAGINDCLGKPFDPQELYQKLCSYLGSPAPAAAITPINYARLMHLSYGNRQLQEDLTQIYIQTFCQLPDAYAEALMAGDSEQLEFLLHKAKPAIRLLETRALEAELGKWPSLTGQTQAQLKQHLETVQKLCQQVVRELQQQSQRAGEQPPKEELSGDYIFDTA